MNWGSILAQAQTAMATPKRQAEANKKVDDYILNGTPLAKSQTRKPIIEAGNKFVQILQSKVQQHAGSDYANGNLGGGCSK